MSGTCAVKVSDWLSIMTATMQAAQRGGADADDDDLVIDLNESSDEAECGSDDLTLSSDDEPSPPTKKAAGKAASKKYATECAALCSGRNCSQPAN